MASIQVKIIIGVATKTFKFSPEQSVADALKDIRQANLDKMGAEADGGADHGLFQASGKGKKARWLKNNRPLKFYNVTSGVRLLTARIFSHLLSSTYSYWPTTFSSCLWEGTQIATPLAHTNTPFGQRVP